MRSKPVAKALILSLMLGCGVLGCGKYGPPVRVYNREAPVTAQPSQADEADDETEPEADRP